MAIDELRIRNVDPEVVLKLTSMAKKHGMNRSEYVRGILTNHVLSLEIKEVDDKYKELFKIVIDTMAGNAMLLHEILVAVKGTDE